eukprot:CAMPEP_0171061104 /NCGR_PEP_ID=MMETSP0766_2-20121228/4223_1 /TAXON_ID=439317 /ORGANISM="Gambierdiscus australes, Strain CAWD 149" /LENGTH=90 /DNA_ID=CAMNT_0011516735 /DNA_START=168 /DNA_END=437 /DNA_ORIENTATION=+
MASEDLHPVPSAVADVEPVAFVATHAHRSTEGAFPRSFTRAPVVGNEVFERAALVEDLDAVVVLVADGYVTIAEDGDTLGVLKLAWTRTP